MRNTKTMVVLRRLARTSFSLSVLFLYSCGSPLAPFDPGVVNQVKDENAPVIEIISPVADSLYSQTVTITGCISDDGSVLPVLEYTVSDVLGSQMKSGEVAIIPDEADSGVSGSFTFNFATSEYSTDILLTLTGRDWNSNEGAPVTLRLVYPGSGISSLETLPGNKIVSLRWEAVEDAESYNLYYTSDGSYPSKQFGTRLNGLQSSYTDGEPLVIEELENGEIYTFLLIASSGTKEWRSDYKQAVPLSPLSLKPEISSLYNSLQLSWQTMSPKLGYQVYKSVGNSDDYVNITGVISATSFTDNNLVPGTLYSYKVMPSVEGSILSESSSASPVTFPSTSYRAVSETITGGSSDIDVAGSIAYLAYGTSGIRRVNISNKDNPVALTVNTWPGCNVKAIDVFGYYVYTADKDNGMKIYSFNKTVDYGPLGLCPTTHSSGKINDVVYSDADTCVYAAWPLDGVAGGIDKIDVTDKSSPVIVDTYTRSDADYFKVAVSSDGAYLYAVYIDPLSPYFGMDIIDTSTMLRAYPSTGNGLPALDVALSGDYAYVIDGTWLTIYDVSNPVSPVEKGKCAVLGDGREVDVDGDFAYVTEEYSGVSMINISDPSNPVLIDSYSKDTITGIDVYDGYAYLSGYDPDDVSNSELSILKVSGFFELNQLSLHPVAEEAFTLKRSGDYMLVGTYDGNVNTDDPLKVIDITDPSGPGDLCSFTPAGAVRGIQASNGYIYLSVSEFGGIKALQVVDFSSPEAGWSPDVYTYELTEDVGGLAVKGDYAYIANNSAGFTIVDISDPDNSGWPTFSLTVDTFGKISDCVIEGDRLYLLTSILGLQIYDITDPVNPEFMGLYSTDGSASGIDVQNGWVYIADRLDGLKMIDVSHPAVSGWEPDVYSYKLEGAGVYTTDVKVEGDYAYFTYYDGVSPYDDVEPGVAVIGISNPALPYLVGQMNVQGEDDNNLAVDCEYIYIAGDVSGLEVIEITFEE